MLGREASSPGSMVLEFNAATCTGIAGLPPALAPHSLTSSQVLRRSTAIRWNFREYRFRFNLLQPHPQSVPILAVSFQGCSPVEPCNLLLRTGASVLNWTVRSPLLVEEYFSWRS